MQLRSILDKEETKEQQSWSVSSHQDKLTAISFVGSEDIVASASANSSEQILVWKVGSE